MSETPEFETQQLKPYPHPDEDAHAIVQDDVIDHFPSALCPCQPLFIGHDTAGDRIWRHKFTKEHPN